MNLHYIISLPHFMVYYVFLFLFLEACHVYSIPLFHKNSNIHI